VNNGVLRLCATELSCNSNAPASAVSGIVSIKALFGFDTRVVNAAINPFTPDNGLQISQWSAGMINVDAAGNPLTVPQAYQRLAAVRLAVVARSRESEKPDADGICRLDGSVNPHIPIAQPTVFASREPANIVTVPIQVNVAVAGDTINWTCYRYRVSETIVPLRNSGWKP
jgi:type IV pilus assembly protein PilW